MSGSVGSLHISDQLMTEDCVGGGHFPWEAFAKHEMLSSIRSIATLSVARTWRVSAAADATAGGEGAVTIHVGQPISSGTLLISVLPLQRKPGSEPWPDEKLEQTVTVRGEVKKGSSRTLKYGPVCRAGAHVVSVTLNGAHVVNSPLHVTISPGPPDATMTELVPLDGRRGGGKSEVRTCTGEATSEIPIGVQLRDCYGNKCSDAAAYEIANEAAAIRVNVRRQLDDERFKSAAEGAGADMSTKFDPSTYEPSAFQPVEGSAAFEERVGVRLSVAAVRGREGRGERP